MERLARSSARRDAQDRWEERQRRVGHVGAPEEAPFFPVPDVPQVALGRVLDDLAGDDPAGDDVVRPRRRRISYWRPA